MQVALVAAVLGVAAGYAGGGRLRHVGERRVERWPLLVVGAVLQVLAPNGLTLAASFLCLLACCLANLRLVGMGVVAVGLALNALVITANGAMPVRAAALVHAGIADDLEGARAEDLGAKRRLEEPGDRLTVLGDVLPVRPLRQVLSFGDLVVAVGTADVIAHLMRRRRARAPVASPAEVRPTGGRFSRLWITMPKPSLRPRSDPAGAGGATPGSSAASSGATWAPSRPADRAEASVGPSRVSAPGS